MTLRSSKDFEVMSLQELIEILPKHEQVLLCDT